MAKKNSGKIISPLTNISKMKNYWMKPHLREKQRQKRM
jgi:hypothetical protein